MELSYFLAQFFGLLLVIFGLASLLRPMLITVAIRDLRPYSCAMLIAGLLGVVAGLLVILTHNVWEMSWRVIITLFGWMALFKGIIYIAFPDFLRFTAIGMINGRGKRAMLLVVVLLLGFYLTIKGFGLR